MTDDGRQRGLLGFMELFIVLAFGVGWFVLERLCKRLDREREAANVQKHSTSSEGAPRHPEG